VEDASVINDAKPPAADIAALGIRAGTPAEFQPERPVRSGVAQLRSAVRGIPKIPAAILVVFVVAGLIGPWVTPHDPLEQNLAYRLQAPAWESGGSRQFLLGTDTLGRDLLSRLIAGAQVSLAVATVTVFIAGGIGVMVGVVSGYFGGWVDYVLMRLTDGFMSLPFLVVALALAVVLRPSVISLIFILVFFGWAGYARIIRTSVLQLREADFVQLAKVAGCGSRRILWRHIAPNVLNTFVVLATLQLGVVIISEASLSFLGIGVPAPKPAWGAMLADGRVYVATAWWISVFPGIAIALVVLSVSLLGDWLRLRLDPRFRQL
jgi:peptide/nickel transport system permease protein